MLVNSGYFFPAFAKVASGLKGKAKFLHISE